MSAGPWFWFPSQTFPGTYVIAHRTEPYGAYAIVDDFGSLVEVGR